MHNLINKLGERDWKVRVLYAFVFFFVLLALSYAVGFVLLPEGSLKKLPFPVFGVFKGQEAFASLFIKTLVYNIFMLAFIVLMNIFRVRSFTFGYLPLYANTIILGLFAGTNSFSGGISAYTTQGFLLFLRVGLLEFSAYILAATATVNFAMYYADKWRGDSFKKVKDLRDLKLSPQEVILLILAIILLVVAAFNEWR